MSDDTRDVPVRTLLARRVREVVDRVASGEEPSKDEVDALERFAKVLSLEQSFLRARRRRVVGVGVLVLVIVAAAIVMTVRVWHTAIAVDASVTALSFTPAEPAYLVGRTVPVERLSLRDVDSVRAMQLRNGRDTTLVAYGRLTFAARHDTNTRKFMALNSLVAAPSTVRIRLEDSGTVHFDFRPASAASFDASVASVIDVESDDGTMVLDFDKAGLLRVFHGREPIAVSFRPAGGRHEMRTPLKLSGLSLYSIDERNGETLSTLRRGAVGRESLGRDSIRLRRDETLVMELRQKSENLLRSLVVDDDDVSVFFRGSVTDVWTVAGNERQTLRPTLLEWARAQNAAWWLWTTILPIASVVLGLGRWWREPR